MNCFLICIRVLDETQYADINKLFGGHEARIVSGNKNSPDLIFSQFFKSEKPKCRIKVPSKGLLIYKNANSFTKNTVCLSESTKYDENLVHYLVGKELKINIGMCNNSQYIISPNKIKNVNFELYTNMFSLPEETFLNVYGNSPRNICYKDKIIFDFKSIYIHILLSFLIIFAFRYLNNKTIIEFQKSEQTFMWFVSQSASNITKGPKLNYEQNVALAKLLQNAKAGEKVQMTVTGQYYSPSKTKIERMHVIQLNRYIYLVFLWTEINEETGPPPEQVIDDAILKVDDVDQQIDVFCHVETVGDGNVQVRIPFEVDEEKIDLILQPEREDKFPYGLFSLLETYTDYIHGNIFREGMDHINSRPEFLNYLEKIFKYLGYVIFIVFTSKDGITEPIICFSKDNNEQLIADGKKFVSDQIANGFDTGVPRITIGNTRYSVSKFICDDVEYFVLLGLDASQMIMRAVEGRFNFLVTMTIAFNHQLLEQHSDILVFPHLTELIRKSGYMAFVEAKGDPLNIISTIGHLECTKITRDLLARLIKNTVLETTQDGIFSPHSQTLIPIYFEDGRMASIAVTCASYLDGKSDSLVYNYLLEDYSAIDPTAVPEFIRSLPVVFCCGALNVHIIHPETFAVLDPSRLALELHLNEPPKTLHKCIAPQELQRLQADLLPERSFVFHLICGRGLPHRYICISPKKGDNLFIFAAPKLAPALHPDQLLGAPVLEERFLPLLYSTEERTVTDLEGRTATLDSFLSGHVLEPDRAVLEEKIKRSESESFPIRVYNTNKDFEWVLACVLKSPTPEVFHIHLWTFSERTRKAIVSRDFVESVNSSFAAAKMNTWTFENAHSPARIFRTRPATLSTIANWTTIEYNVPPAFRPFVSAVVKKGLADPSDTPVGVIFPLVFDDSPAAWYLMRGMRDSNGELSGVMFDLGTITQTSRGEKIDPHFATNFSNLANLIFSVLSDLPLNKDTNKLLVAAYTFERFGKTADITSRRISMPI